MRTFLLKNNIPVIKWGGLPDNTFFEGEIPDGYNLAISPSGNTIIIDVDVKGNKNGFENIPHLIQMELDKTFNYKTKSGGAHYYINYSGSQLLMNRATKHGIDLRIGAKDNNAGGYAKYYHNKDIRECIDLIKNSSEHMNKWIEKLFSSPHNN